MAKDSTIPQDNASLAAGNPAPDDLEKELPGYPHYPAEEDIMNPQNGFEKSTADLESLSNAKKSAAPINSAVSASAPEEEPQEEEDLERTEDATTSTGSEADLTPEDLIALGEKDGDMDMGEDEIIGKQSKPDQHEDLEEEDLDIPGSELDDDNEEIGAEDEENNYYSLGGDRHEDQENEP